MVSKWAGNLLRTKATVPSLSKDYVVRTRLLDKLKLAADRRITIIHAPAGYGKTTLALSWLQQCEVPAAWVSLDVENNDVVLFWRYVAYSLSFILPDDTYPIMASAMNSLPAKDAHVLPDFILNELAYCPLQFTMVFDDYHFIEEPLIHEGMTRFIDYLPSNVHVVLLSRMEPPFPLSKWSSKGWSNVIDQVDLAFTEQETKEFFKKVFQVYLSPAESRHLSAATEGWVVGLQLLGLSMRPYELPEKIFKNGFEYHEIISNYLMEEVVKNLPADLQEFLLRISIAKSFDANLACILTDIRDAESMIGRLIKMGLFIVPLERERKWYRFHHLFSDFLQNKLRSRDISLWTALHQKTARFLIDNNRTLEAMEHLHIIQDYDQLAALIDQTAIDLINKGQIYTLLHWLNRIPEPEKYLQPITWAFVAFAMTLGGDMMRAEAILTDLEERYRDSEPFSEKGRVYGVVCRVKAFIMAGRGRLDTCFYYIDQFFKYTPTEDAMLWRTIRPHRGELFLIRTDLAHKGKADVSPKEAAEFMDRLLLHGRKILKKSPPLSHLPAYLYVAICEGYYEYNQLNKAEEYLLKALSIAELHKDLFLLVPIYTNMSRLFLAQGMYEEALQKIEQAIQLAGEYAEPYWVQPLIAYQVQILLRGNRLNDAIQHSQRLRIARGEMIRREKYYEYVALVRLFIETQDYTEAMRIVAELRAIAKMEDQYYSYVEITMLKTIIEWELGRIDSAYRSLHEALTLGQKYDYCRIYLDEKRIHKVIQGYAVWRNFKKNNGWKSVSADYLNKLLSLLPKDSSEEDAIRAKYSLLELSVREWEVARCVAKGLSNKQIAETLMISYRTVTTHLEKMYRKLEVHSRTELITKLNRLGWETDSSVRFD
ncbi:putative Transcriptional regulator, LuxR family [[Clostridium] ultunense Esp]|nr:putative Transcriptional regulator, LuxR family [[Clostridium] ultunense Esp]